MCVIVRGEEGAVRDLHSKPLSSYLTVSITGIDLETGQLHHYERERHGERESGVGYSPYPPDALTSGVMHVP